METVTPRGVVRRGGYLPPMGRSPAPVFASRLAGLAVLDPSGERVGRLADVVAAPGLPGAPVLGVVVRVRRRPIFVSAGRLEALDDQGARLSSARVSLRRFERRPGEVLVLGELLDRVGTLSPAGERVRVNDVGVSRSQDGTGWCLVSADVVPAGARLRRDHRVVDWDELSGLGMTAPDALARAAALGQLRPAEVASTVMGLGDRDAAELLGALEDERAADVLEELPEDVQARLLRHLGRERAGDLLDAMNPDDAADLLGEIPAVERADLLSAMEPEEAAPVRRLLEYRPDTAGGLMNPEPVVLPPNATVAEALARLRKRELPPSLAAQVYVVRPPAETPTGPLLGTAHFQRLLREPPSALAATCIDPAAPDPLTPDAPAMLVAEHLAAENLLAAPVCDAAGRLLGAVSVDDVLDALLPKGWRSARDTASGEEAP